MYILKEKQWTNAIIPVTPELLQKKRKLILRSVESFIGVGTGGAGGASVPPESRVVALSVYITTGIFHLTNLKFKQKFKLK